MTRSRGHHSLWSVLLSSVLVGVLGPSLVGAGTTSAGIDSGLQHAYDIPGTVLKARYGFAWGGIPGADRLPAKAEVWVSRSLVGPEELGVVKKVVDASLSARAERIRRGTSAPSTIRVIGNLLSNGNTVLATVYSRLGEYSVQAYDVSPSGVVKGPIVADEFSSDLQNAFIVHDESTVTALVVTSTDRFGMLQSSVVTRDGTKAGFAGAKIAEIKAGDSARVIMLVTGRQEGADVLRIIEVTDHIEDLVPPVSVKELGDSRREPNLTQEEWKARRKAENEMSLKFEQIVRSGGGTIGARLEVPK
jgi:hypothetical protein